MEAWRKGLAAGGAILAMSSVALPWAKVGSGGEATHAISGFGHGIEPVLALVSVGIVSLFVGIRVLAFLSASGAALWTAIVIYELPGSLTSSGTFDIAGMSWGALAAITGSVAVALAALVPFRRPRLRRNRTRRHGDSSPGILGRDLR